ncbi:MAG: DUF5658 family protein [Desulfobacterales bacterium]|nr:DUF5658 family protein [Desulfobacterales bacterium]
MASVDCRKDISGSRSDISEKRSGDDRRTHQFPKLKYLLFSGRRANVRRKEDLHHTFYFDRYSSSLFAAIVAILLLSVLDALLTLHLISVGSTELNPVMSYFLNYGPFVFMGAKYFLTCFGVVVLLLFRNVLRKRSITHAQNLFSYIIGAFTTVIVWELYLIFFVVS